MLLNIKSIKFPRITRSTNKNSEERKYQNYNYNGSFHKGLAHNMTDGRLISSTDYENMVNAIVDDDQKMLSEVPLAGTLKIANALASWATVITGAPQNSLTIPDPPSLSSAAGAAEMLEIYAQAIARDVALINYQ